MYKTDSLFEVLYKAKFSDEKIKAIMDLVGEEKDVSRLPAETKEEMVLIIEGEMNKGKIDPGSMDDLIIAMESFAHEVSEAEAEDATDLSDVEEVLEKK